MGWVMRSNILKRPQFNFQILFSWVWYDPHLAYFWWPSNVKLFGEVTDFCSEAGNTANRRLWFHSNSIQGHSLPIQVQSVSHPIWIELEWVLVVITSPKVGQFKVNQIQKNKHLILFLRPLFTVCWLEKRCVKCQLCIIMWALLAIPGQSPGDSILGEHKLPVGTGYCLNVV